MSDKIRMTHPDLPESEIFARPAQVPVRELSGWVADAAPAAEQAGTVVPVPAPTGAARTTTTKEG